MRMILALVVLGAVGFGLLAFAGDGVQADTTVCWGAELGIERCWTVLDPAPPPPPPPLPWLCPLNPAACPPVPEPIPTPTPIDQFCFALLPPNGLIVCIPD